ncbi:MAG: nitroreductase family protein [candidate division WOR-3 bacterium]|nr:nitroreductase family protein [candidate division WOR-3 bacterium]
MEFLELVKKRRSIRAYSDKSLKREDILKCLEAARLAPSACNAQPWKFVIVVDKDLISKIAQKTLHSIYSFNRFIENAGALICVVSEKEGLKRYVGKRIMGTDYYLIDIGIACEHLVLQATELGIGSCWIGWFDERRLKDILNVPEKKRVAVIIALGYTKKPSTTCSSRKKLERIISFNEY